MITIEKLDENIQFDESIGILDENIQFDESSDILDIILYFFNTCGITCSNINEIDGVVISRELLLNDTTYEKLKKHIHKLKSELSSSVYTSTQKKKKI